MPRWKIWLWEANPLAADEVVAYAKNWKIMFPDMIGTCETIGMMREMSWLKNVHGLAPIQEILRCLMETPSRQLAKVST